MAEYQSGFGNSFESEALPGAGSAPGTIIPSVAIELPGDHLATLRAAPTPIVARARDGVTTIDLRTVHPSDDTALTAALAALPA